VDKDRYRAVTSGRRSEDLLDWLENRNRHFLDVVYLLYGAAALAAALASVYGTRQGR
jgi:hypothetical protein